MNTKTINTQQIKTPAEMADAIRVLVARCDEIGDMEDISRELENAIANSRYLEDLRKQAAVDHATFERLRATICPIAARYLGGA